MSASAKAASDNSTGAANRNASKEMVSASAMGETGTVVDSGYEKNSSVSLVRLVQAQTGGREEVAGPWCALNARAEVGNGRSFTSGSGSGSYTTTTHITGLFRALTSYGSQTDTRGVIITSSTIEDSFMKAGTEPRKNERMPDGQIFGDSVAEWVEMGAYWRAVNGFTAIPTGFTSPTYKWSIEGASDPAPGYSHVSTYTSSGLVLGLKMGVDRQGKDLPGSSTLKVAVTDGPGTDGATGENTFHVTWHLPIENGVPDGLGIKTWGYDTRASSWTPVNKTVAITITPSNVAWQLAATAGSGLLSAASAGTRMVWSDPRVAGVAAVILSLASFGLSEARPENQSDSKWFGYAEYADAVRRQYARNRGEPGTQNIQYVFPSELAERAYPGLTSPDNAAADPVWSAGGLLGRFAVARPKTDQPWIGDGYGKNGYYGPERYRIQSEGQHEMVPQLWDGAGGSINAPP